MVFGISFSLSDVTAYSDFSSMEEKIKAAIKQAGALLRPLHYNNERKGWMVEYDRNTRLCICVENEPSGYDYASDAWSCDSLCYLVFVNDKVRVYSLAEDVPSEYDASLVLDNFEDFVHYVKKFFVKESANIYNYLKQVYSEVVNARTECDFRELSPSEILCDIFYSEMGNEYPNDLIKVASEALSGVVYGRKTVRPNKILVCNNVLPRFFDVVVMLESISANETEANLKLQNAQFRSVDSLFLPEIAASHLAGITLKECKKKESLKIFDPFVWGTSVLLNIVRRIRSNTPNAEIHIKGYSLSKYPEKILDCLFASYAMREMFGLQHEQMLCVPNERHGKFLLNEIMISGNMGHHDERLKEAHMGSRWQRFCMVTKHNMRLISYYPAETLWAPFIRIKIWAWRKWNGWI